MCKASPSGGKMHAIAARIEEGISIRRGNWYYFQFLQRKTKTKVFNTRTLGRHVTFMSFGIEQ